MTSYQHAGTVLMTRNIQWMHGTEKASNMPAMASESSHVLVSQTCQAIVSEMGSLRRGRDCGYVCMKTLATCDRAWHRGTARNDGISLQEAQPQHGIEGRQETGRISLQEAR